MSLYYDENVHDANSTRKVPENTRLSFVFPLGIFPVEMMSLMFLSQHRDTKVIFYSLNRMDIQGQNRKIKSMRIVNVKLPEDFDVNLVRSHCHMKHGNNNPPYLSRNRKMSQNHGMLACIPWQKILNATA